MKGKILPLFVIALIFAPIRVIAAPQKPVPISPNHGWLGYGLYFEVEAPSEAKVGEFMLVSFKFWTEYDMHIDLMYVGLFGAGIDYSMTLVVDADVRKDTWITKITMVKPASEGGISCAVHAEFERYKFGDIVFVVTYARTITYDTLKTDYDDLKVTHDKLMSDYNDLQSSYSSLKGDYDGLKPEYESTTRQLNTNTNFMYVFVVTTTVFIVATVYFARRRPKQKIAEGVTATAKIKPSEEVETGFAPSVKPKLELEKERITEMLRAFKEKYEKGEISEEAYEKLKTKYEEKLREIERRL